MTTQSAATQFSSLFKTKETAADTKVVMGIKVEKQLRDAFNMLCLKNSVSAAEVIRNFMEASVMAAIKEQADSAPVPEKAPEAL